MKIGILGGSGLLGHHIAIQALLHQHELVLIHRANTDQSKIADLTYESRIADLNDRGSLIRAFAGLDAVVNAAAYYPTIPKPLAQEVKTARLQMKFFLDALSENKIAKALYVGGSIAIPKRTDRQANEGDIYTKVPELNSAYLHVKYLMDEMAREAGKDGIPIVVGIPTMTFGEYDFGPSTGRLITAVANQKLPAYIHGERNVVFGRDAGRGLLYALEKGTAGERYIIGGHNTDIKTLVELICQKAEIPLLEKTMPLRLAKIISKFQETRYALFRGELPTLSDTAITVLSQGQHLNMVKAKKELGYEPELDLQDTINLTYNWFKKVGYV
ncbi:nucleoside-diphosphate-sugar epimerase [Roseivirga pacifica]|uniref:Nucleoside-diphosphate-sugar epimerase n=1 Tax=Roseivirga pacifica TaxID=1267423 RepID=A0A1I0QXT7_9BACT|nr:NAD-dependent epimerase/dehydratase family protein [Roseivirga pacifica]RKQ42369.1 nucleoside-diphosphate-sugar epimerase [Roseivirga pacifica]SEW32643.1 Nucleoside-diphosphate-sugar epimerase [Roseivirga pacifica]